MTGPLISRRATMAGIGAAAMPTGLLAQAGSPSLADLARTKGVLFGTAVGAGRPGTLTGMFNDPRTMALVDRECAVIVAENEMKQYVIAAKPDSMDFARGDQLATWSQTHGKKLRGHTLLWNHPKYTPAWLTARYADEPADRLATWLTGYVGAVASHFGTTVHSWDVVNETIDPATGELRDSLFQGKLGFEALRLAFATARERAPHAQRVYNDYMSWGNARRAIMRSARPSPATSSPPSPAVSVPGTSSFAPPPDMVRGVVGLTTREAIATEKRMLGLERAGRGTRDPLCDDDTARYILAKAEDASEKIGHT